jgi:hypothetical protein
MLFELSILQIITKEKPYLYFLLPRFTRIYIRVMDATDDVYQKKIPETREKFNFENISYNLIHSLFFFSFV